MTDRSGAGTNRTFGKQESEKISPFAQIWRQKKEEKKQEEKKPISPFAQIWR